MRTCIAILATLFLASCASVGHQVASGISNTQLKRTVGKPYEQVMYEHPDFGKLIGRESLPAGHVIMKHVGDFGQETSDYGGIYGKRVQNARVIYFLVDSNGVVKDWATEFYRAGTANCWVGICSGAKAEQVPFEELDRIVRTSSGQTLDAWRSRS
jgi:hypothetical protein